MNATTCTTASTYNGPPITAEAVCRSINHILQHESQYRLPAPIRLTRSEINRLADLLHCDRPAKDMANSLAGIPIVEMPEDSPFVRMFTLQERIERTHPLMRTP
jgi:hypothetical protein